LGNVGIPASEFGSFTAGALNASALQMLVTLPSAAADSYTAIAQARRKITEALDQYAAGQRLLKFTIADRSMAMPESNAFFVANQRTAGVQVARPLTSHWPAPLRSALRMANLADHMDAPAASVMLAWSAIESMGITSNDFDMLAKSCALHSLRQQILSLYQSIVDSATANLRYCRWRVNRKQAELKYMERSLAVAKLSNTIRAREAAVELESAVDDARAQLQEAEADLQSLQDRSYSA
jgi:hypothetical protein